MLSADKDLLLAKLNQDLLALHLLELNTVLNRFQNTIGASSLLGGFAYAAIIQAELDIGWRGNPDQLVSEAVFFLAASITLSLAMFAMSVSTYASILGYRVSVQSAQQNSIMKATKMLLRFYTWVLVAGVLAMFTIIIAAMAIVFFKAEKTVRWPSTVIFLVAIPVRSLPPRAASSTFATALAPTTLTTPALIRAGTTTPSLHRPCRHSGECPVEAEAPARMFPSRSQAPPNPQRAPCCTGDLLHPARPQPRHE